MYGMGLIYAEFWESVRYTVGDDLGNFVAVAPILQSGSPLAVGLVVTLRCESNQRAYSSVDHLSRHQRLPGRVKSFGGVENLFLVHREKASREIIRASTTPT